MGDYGRKRSIKHALHDQLKFSQEQHNQQRIWDMFSGANLNLQVLRIRGNFVDVTNLLLKHDETLKVYLDHCDI